MHMNFTEVKQSTSLPKQAGAAPVQRFRKVAFPNRSSELGCNWTHKLSAVQYSRREPLLEDRPSNSFCKGGKGSKRNEG